MKRRLLLFPSAILSLTLLCCKEKLPINDTAPPKPDYGQSNFALKFDGANNFIVLDNIPKATRTNNTICARIYIDNIQNDLQSWIFGIGGRQSLIIRESGKASLANFLAKGESDPGKLQMSWWRYCDDIQAVPLKRWVHFEGITETDDNITVLKLYRDGQLVTTLPVEGGIQGNYCRDA